MPLFRRSREGGQRFQIWQRNVSLSELRLYGRTSISRCNILIKTMSRKNAILSNDIQKSLSAAEWQVMKVVWELNEGAARDIYAVACRRHGWAVDTVKTMLRRLTEKGYLTTRLIGNSFLYKPSISAAAALKHAADELLAKTVEGTVGPLVLHIVRNSELSDADLRELRAMLDEKDDVERKTKIKRTNTQK